MLCHIFPLILVPILWLNTNGAIPIISAEKGSGCQREPILLAWGSHHCLHKHEIHPRDSSCSAHSGMKIRQRNTWRVCRCAQKFRAQRHSWESARATTVPLRGNISKFLADYGGREEVVERVQEQLRLSDCAKHEDWRWTADLRQLPTVQEQGHCHRTWSAWCGNSSIRNLKKKKLHDWLQLAYPLRWWDLTHPSSVSMCSESDGALQGFMVPMAYRGDVENCTGKFPYGTVAPQHIVSFRRATDNFFFLNLLIFLADSQSDNAEGPVRSADHGQRLSARRSARLLVRRILRSRSARPEKHAHFLHLQGTV